MVAGPFEAIRGNKDRAVGINQQFAERSKQRMLDAGASLRKGAGNVLREGATVATATVLAAPEIASWTKGKVQEGGAFVKGQALEKAGQLKGWFQKQVEAVRSGADTAKQYGQTKKDQLFNLAHAGREAVQTKFQQVRDGVVTGVTNQVNTAKEAYASRQNQRQVDQLDQHAQTLEAQIANIRQLMETLPQHLDQLLAQRKSIANAIDTLRAAPAALR